ncbi:MAG: HrpJ domain-containing protein, partial [Pseudomonadota bacterium]
MPETSINAQNMAAGLVNSQMGSEYLQAIRGERKGDAATIMVKPSDLNSLKEEIGNAVAKFADKKTLGQAKIRQSAGSNREAVKRIVDFFDDKLPDMPRDASLLNLVNQLLEFLDIVDGGGQLSADDLLEALRTYDGDVTHQFAALQAAQRHFEREDASTSFRALLDAAERAYDDPGIKRDIQAGYAIAQAASEAAPTLETSPAALRDTYREMLRSKKHMGQLFDQLVQYNIRLNFSEVVDLFLQTAGHELANVDSKVDPIILGALVRELSVLKEMRTVVTEADRVIVKTRRIDPQFMPDDESDNYAIKLTSDFLNFAAQVSPSLSDARKLVPELADGQEQTKVVFANELHNWHRLVSDKSLASTQARLHQSQALLSLRVELS